MPNPPTDHQLQTLHEALLSALNFDDLRMLTKLRLDTDLEQIVLVQGRTLTQMTYDLIRVFAAREDGLHRLMTAAKAFAPGNVLLTTAVDELAPLQLAPLPLPEDFRAGGCSSRGCSSRG